VTVAEGVVGGPIEVERRGAVLLVCLNRPERRNALDLPTMYALGATFADASADDSVHALVLAARGPVFCAGIDLKAYTAAMASPEGPGEINAAALAGLSAARPGLGVLTREPFAKPVLCAVQGPAIGLGFELVLAADVVVAGPATTFALPEVKHGLAPSGSGAGRLVKRLSSLRAVWLLLAGESIDAAEAYRFGLLTEVVGEHVDPVARALEMAAVIAAQPAEAVRAAKAIAVQSLDLFDPALLAAGDEAIARLTDRSAGDEAIARLTDRSSSSSHGMLQP
jgi:enoyl-CoA hydratase